MSEFDRLTFTSLRSFGVSYFQIAEVYLTRGYLYIFGHVRMKLVAECMRHVFHRGSNDAYVCVIAPPRGDLKKNLIFTKKYAPT